VTRVLDCKLKIERMCAHLMESHFQLVFFNQNLPLCNTRHPLMTMLFCRLLKVGHFHAR
jgi:hypothetical protein